MGVINAKGVTHHYGVRPVLVDVSFEVKKGELLAVMGPNGMGKSTLLGCMAGVLSPLKGHVEFDGVARRSSVRAELAIRKKVVYLPDHPWLPTDRTPREYLMSVGQLYEVETHHLLDHVERLLELFHLNDKGDSPISALSNGQKKKTAIAGALIADTPILILDEPFTGGLDPSGILALRRVLSHLAEREDVTVVIATQLAEIVESTAHRVLMLSYGKIKALKTVNELRQEKESSQSLGEAIEHLMSPDTVERVNRYFQWKK